MATGFRAVATLRKLLLLLAVVALLGGADLGARRATEIQLEHRIAAAVPSASAESVSIHSVPYLGRLGLRGRVTSVHASVAGVTVSGLRFRSLAVDLRDVRLDRNRLVLHRDVEIRAIGRSTATADIAQDDLRSVLRGFPLVLGNGSIGLTVAGHTFSLSATVRDNVLRLSAAGITIPTVSIPQLPLLPCVSQAVATPGHLHLSCSVDQIPSELLRRVNG